MANISFFSGDLPDDVSFQESIAVDTETMGLNLHRDRLCLVQIADKQGNCYLIQIKKGIEPRHLKEVLSDKNLLKIFHFARFDVAAIKQYLGVDCAPIYCTKIAHKLVRTSSDAHSLKALCKEFLDIELEKEQQVSDWGAEELSEKQLHYAANDVLYLHAIKEKLDALLTREGRFEVAHACFNFMSARAELDLQGFDCPDIFAH